MQITLLLKTFFLLVFILVTNIPYKKTIFNKKIGLGQILFLSFIFKIASLLLLIYSYEKIIIKTNNMISIPFIIITITWFIYPILIRFFGKYPITYIEDKNNKARFVVKFEFPSMIIKYFEILFQQVSFAFLLFVILIGLPKTSVVFFFAVIVVIMHLGNLFFINTKWSLYYTVLSLPMAITFSYLILDGYLLITFTIHLLFYLTTNSYYWFDPKYSKS